MSPVNITSMVGVASNCFLPDLEKIQNLGLHVVFTVKFLGKMVVYVKSEPSKGSRKVEFLVGTDIHHPAIGDPLFTYDAI